MRTETVNAFQSLPAGRYTIERELGEGGMATVYLARDARDGRDVAVKVLLPDLAASIGAERFLREIELGKVLQHPNIVSVLDSGAIGGQLYYTMPYIDGESLRDRLDRERQLTIEDTLEITKQVAEALDFAHGKGVIHRDIKPENILLKGNKAWVADFGIARAVTVAGGEKLTKTGMAVGTPTYMSPEQALGSKDVTAQSDVYCLGCVVYEMLAGQPPFAGANPMALLAKHSLENVPSIRIVRQSVPPELEDAIFCSLEKTPADRFKTAGLFAKALAGEAPVPRRARTGQAQTRRRAMSPVKMAAAAVAIAAVLGGGTFATMKAMSRGAAASRIGTDSDPTHIAVLYFEDGSPKKDLGYLADGFTESLIHELSAVKQLSVISRNGVAPIKGKLAAIDSVGKALKVGTVVNGKISQVGDQLQLEVTLTDALTNTEIATTRIKQPRDSLIALQEQLATEVADQLRTQLGGQVLDLQRRVGTRSADAWAAMERAKQTIAAAEPLLAAGNAGEAQRQFEQADGELAAVEKLDDKWTVPIVQRGWLQYRLSRLAASTDRSQMPKLIDAGLAHAERALAKESKDADALDLRGTLRYWKWLSGLATDVNDAQKILDGAEADLNAATAANPQQATAWNTLSHLRLARQRISAGKIAADNAYKADPYLTNIDQTIWRQFQSSLDLGKRGEATKACETGQRRFPDNFRFTECQLWLYALELDAKAAKPAASDIWATYDAFLKASPEPLRPFHALKGKMMVALGLIRAGLPDSARSLATITQSTAPASADPNGELVYLRAIVHAQLGTQKDKDEAIRLLTRFLAMNPQQASEGEDESWWMNTLKGDPQYQALFSKR